MSVLANCCHYAHLWMIVDCPTCGREMCWTCWTRHEHNPGRIKEDVMSDPVLAVSLVALVGYIFAGCAWLANRLQRWEDRREREAAIRQLPRRSDRWLAARKRAVR